MAKMRSSAPRANIFNSLAQVKVPQSRFNLSYDNKFTCNMGDLMPFMCKRVVPGDKFNVGSGVFLRFLPLVSPVMHSIDCEIRYFYVPNRIIWPQFDEHITGGDVVHPVIEWHEDEPGDNSPSFYRLADMFNINIVDNNLDASQTHYPYINILPFYAYNSIWNWYFRQQFIQDELESKHDPDVQNNVMSIPEARDLFQIRKVDWRKDYFTSALPFTQLGESAKVSEEVYLRDVRYGVDEQLMKTWVNKGTLENPDYQLQNGIGTSGSTAPWLRTPVDSGTGEGADGRLGMLSSTNGTPKVAYFDPNGTLQVEFPIERLREANALQRFLEKSALGGNRISEFYLNHFGVYVSDTRLQIPQYLGGGRMPVTISEIAQTSETTENGTPQGTLAGKGVASGSVNFKHPYLFKEYGWIIGVFYIRPKASYMNGTPKQMWMESDSRFDNYYFPEFCHLGEQAVRNYEIYGTTKESTSLAPFGYQSRDADYKYFQDEIHGDLKTTLKFWTLGRDFEKHPNLNDEFLTCNPSKDIFAVEDEKTDSVIVDVYTFIDAVRPMTQYGTPALVVE